MFTSKNKSLTGSLAFKIIKLLDKSSQPTQSNVPASAKRSLGLGHASLLLLAAKSGSKNSAASGGSFFGTAAPRFRLYFTPPGPAAPPTFIAPAPPAALGARLGLFPTSPTERGLLAATRRRTPRLGSSEALLIAFWRKLRFPIQKSSTVQVSD